MLTGNSKDMLIVALQIVSLTALVQAAITNLPDSKQNGYAIDGGCTREYIVDYLDLAISWGPGTCQTDKVSCRKDIENKFTIHGLWPQHNGHSTPLDCCTKTFFDHGDVKPLKKDLRAVWPTLENGDDYNFWQYEWNKHGSCAVKIKGISTVREYFEFSVKAVKRLDMLDMLSRNGIKPSNVGLQRGEKINSALNKEIGAKVTLSCAPSKKNPRVLVLNEVHVCFDTKLRLTDCKKNTPRKCRDNILMPQSSY